MRVDFGNGDRGAGSGGGVLNECRSGGDGSGVCASRMEGDFLFSGGGSRDGEVVIWVRV